MWPLLKRDGLAIEYIATLLLWNRLIGYNPFKTPKSLVQVVALVCPIIYFWMTLLTCVCIACVPRGDCFACG